jgi:hypothetical protein
LVQTVFATVGAEFAEDGGGGNTSRFAANGSLTITMSHEQPAGEFAANWLPAPDGQFALIVRAYVPTPPILDGRYKLPNVERQ